MLFWDIWHGENLVKITNNVPSSKICSFLGSAMLIRCWEKYRSHQCFTLAGIWVDASPSPRRRTCRNSRQATLEVDKVGNRVLSCNTTSSATRVRTSRGDRILLLFPSAPLRLDSQFGAEEKEQTSIFWRPTRSSWSYKTVASSMALTHLYEESSLHYDWTAVITWVQCDSPKNYQPCERKEWQMKWRVLNELG